MDSLRDTFHAFFTSCCGSEPDTPKQSQTTPSRSQNGTQSQHRDLYELDVEASARFRSSDTLTGHHAMAQRRPQPSVSNAAPRQQSTYSSKPPAKRLNPYDVLASQKFRVSPSDPEQVFREYQAPYPSFNPQQFPSIPASQYPPQMMLVPAPTMMGSASYPPNPYPQPLSGGDLRNPYPAPPWAGSPHNQPTSLFPMQPIQYAPATIPSQYLQAGPSNPPLPQHFYPPGPFQPPQMPFPPNASPMRPPQPSVPTSNQLAAPDAAQNQTIPPQSVDREEIADLVQRLNAALARLPPEENVDNETSPPAYVEEVPIAPPPDHQ